MALMVVSPPSLRHSEDGQAQVSFATLSDAQRVWLDEVVRRCQGEGISVEIFLSSGPFLDEILSFLDSQSSFQFVVMAEPLDLPKGRETPFSSFMKRLRQGFEGEILLVKAKGGITRLRRSRGRSPTVGS
jgi:hypothetical protein